MLQVLLVSVTFYDVCLGHYHLRIFSPLSEFSEVVNHINSQQMFSADVLTAVDVVVEFDIFRFELRELKVRSS